MGKLCFGLEEKVFVVTGGSRGIGLELARQLLLQKARVVICGRKQEGLEAALADIDSGGDILAVAAHIAREEEVHNLFEQTMSSFGRVDALVNNAGMNLLTPSVISAGPASWQKIIDSNLTGTYLCSAAAAKIMKKQGGGKIVSITSIAGRQAAPGMGIYGVAKAGIEMLTKTLAAELAQDNIQVNAVAPGMVKTGFSKPFWSDREIYEQIVAKVPAGRLAEPLDVVYPVLFLCSAGAGFITGQTLCVDGGATVI
ncbi:MAG: SDR family oxidoreductase [Dethiobacter sp.]|jgi:2-deoxy-D-gluconate 3-dehydrogenase|nr:SDR family oxidoreductase [Dethiobacter sp.]